MTPQTMAAGAVATASASFLGGFTGVNMVPPLTSLFGIVVARSGEGKSSTLQSIPKAFGFNVDGTSTVVPNPPGYLWPGIDPNNGQPIEGCAPSTPGSYNHPKLGTVRRCDLTWGRMKEKQQEILAAVREKPGCVSCVYVDTVDFLLPLVIQWVIEQAPPTKEGVPRTKWDQIDGRAGWDDVYNEILQFGRTFRAAGIGVFYALHLTDKLIKLNATENVLMRDVVQVTDNFWGRLKPAAEFVGIIEARDEAINRMVPKNDPKGNPMRAVDGTPIMMPVVDKERRVYISFDSSKARGVSKGRAGVSGTVFLPKSDPWGTLARSYDEALVSLNK